MAKHLLSKSTYIRSLQCQKSLYLHKKRPFLRDKMLASQLAKFRRGTAVGVLARDLFPGGIDMTPKSPSQYQKRRAETLEALVNPEISVIYEGVFQHNDVLIMLDILVREGQNWRAIEVKSSLSLSETYRQDAFLQYYVLKGNQLELSDFELMYIDKDYILDEQLDLRKLFVSQSVMQEAEANLEQTNNQIEAAKETLQLEKSPDIKIGMQCNYPYPCDFRGHCWKKVPTNSLLYIDAIPTEKRFELFHSGIENVNQLMPDQITKEILAQDNALQAKTFHLNLEKFEALKTNFSSSKRCFIKVLYKQPAVPEQKNTKPYTPHFLAISALITDVEKQEFHSWDCSENPDQWQAGFQFLADLWSKSDIIITFKDPLLLPLLEEFSSQLNPKKLVDFWEILKLSDFYFPMFNTEIDLDALSGFLIENHKPLKHEAWLIKDLTEAPTENRESVISKLKTWVSSLGILVSSFETKN